MYKDNCKHFYRGWNDRKISHKFDSKSTPSTCLIYKLGVFELKVQNNFYPVAYHGSIHRKSSIQLVLCQLMAQ